MPFAEIRISKLPLLSCDYVVFQRAIQALPEIIAEELDVTDPGGSLLSSDVEVEVVKFGPQHIGKYDLELHLEAMKFPSRLKNGHARCQQIYNRFLFMLEGFFQNPALWMKWVDAEFIDKIEEPINEVTIG